MNIKGYTCKLTPERDQKDPEKCKVIWVLNYPNPCECTSVVMGGFNTRIPDRSFVPGSAYTPFLSDDISIIREHYGILCDDRSKFLAC